MATNSPIFNHLTAARQQLLKHREFLAGLKHCPYQLGDIVWPRSALRVATPHDTFLLTHRHTQHVDMFYAIICDQAPQRGSLDVSLGPDCVGSEFVARIEHGTWLHRRDIHSRYSQLPTSAATLVMDRYRQWAFHGDPHFCPDDYALGFDLDVHQICNLIIYALELEHHFEDTSQHPALDRALTALLEYDQE